MAKLLHDLLKRQVLNRGSVPRHFSDSIQYLTIMGSEAYGVSNEGVSDRDVYGFCIPEKHVIFPHLVGHIPGFGTQPEKFEQWQKHGVVDDEKDRVYDFNIYNITKYFQLVMENNPNMVDSLFTPHNAILHCSPIAQMVRDERHIFLHKGAWHKFRGYSYAQLNKIRNKAGLEYIEKVRSFEATHGLLHTTTLEEVQLEIDRRGL